MARIARLRGASLIASVHLLTWMMGACHAKRLDHIHYGGVYMYRMQMEEEAWQRVLNTPEVTYVCSQFGCGGLTETEIRRVREAKQKGKRVVAQLWYGSGSGKFNWSYYSLANIAMDPKIRQDFFDKVLDPTIDALGPPNLYGAHLLEETGMQFGVDLDEPNDPEDLWDGDDNGSNWDQPSWLGSGGVPGYIGGPYVLSVRRYAKEFTQDTGRDLRMAPVWSGADWLTYRKWVSAKLEEGAMVAFADHLHKKYRGIKAFTWDAVGWDGCGANSMASLRGRVDGLIMDPYSDGPGNYAAVRAARMVDPSIEIIAVLWGCDDNPSGERMNRFVSAYLGGADVLLFFGDESPRKEDTWSERVKQVQPFTTLPPFFHHPKVLLVTGRTQDWGGSPTMITGLTSYDVMSSFEAELVDLKSYDLVVLFEGEHPRLKEYVEGGGLAVVIGPWCCPDFLMAGGFLVAPRPRDTDWQSKEVDHHPNDWWRQNLRLAETYPLTLGSRRPWKVTNASVHQDLAFFMPLGKGALCYAPLQTVYPFPPKERLNAYRQLLTDLARGMLLHGGKEKTARDCIADPSVGAGYLRMQSDDGKITGFCLFRQGEVPFKPFRVDGRDVLRSLDNPTLGPEVSSAVAVR